jgi:hypothetical protein
MKKPCDNTDQNAERDGGSAEECRCTFGPRCRIADFHVRPASLLPARYLEPICR